MAAELADVLYHGQKAGVVYWDKSRRTGVFEYTREFVADGKAAQGSPEPDCSTDSLWLRFQSRRPNPRDRDSDGRNL